jgi:hypothetical protein
MMESNSIREYVEGINKLGYPAKLRCWYSIPEAMSRERKQELKEKKAEQKRLASQYSLMEKLLETIIENPGICTTELKKTVRGRSDNQTVALKQLERDGRIYVVSPDKRTRTFYPMAPF